jgi:two-component system response regulator AlgR
MDIVIVDDEPLARDRLQRMLEGYPAGSVVAQAANGQEALAVVERYDPDVVLLDIHMPGDSGLAVAQQLLALEDPPAVIFCTAHQQHALQAFAVNAVDYLLKPVRKEKLFAALDKVQTLNKAQRSGLKREALSSKGRSHISAKTRRGVELLALDHILFFSADQKYVTVYHRGGETLLDDTLKELEDELGGSFVRIHRNALASLGMIEALEKNNAGQFELRLKGSELRPVVSRRHVSGLRALLEQI